MGLIFFFSHQPADLSSSMSNPIVDGLLEFGERLNLVSDPNQARKLLIFVVRKLAHFSVYLILGVLMSWTLSQYQFSKWVLFSFLFCILYASSDEFHQFFILGRSCELRDVLIDSIGSLVGIGFVIFIKNKSKRGVRC